MSDAEIRQAVLRALAHVAPEMDAATIRPTVPLRDQIDLDSIDFLNFIIELDHELGIDVPEADYDEVRTLDAAVAYMGRRLAAR